MSLFPILSLSVILAGAAIVGLLAWFRPRFAPVSSGIVLGLALLLWLIAGQNLPLGKLPDDGASMAVAMSPYLHVDAIGWQLSFYLLLLMMAVVVGSLSHFDKLQLVRTQTIRQKALFPAILLVCAAALLTLWTASLAGLITTWVILSFAWLVLLWAISEERVGAGTLLTRGGAMLLGVLFLWLAAGVSGVQGGRQLISSGWSSGALVLLLLAAMGPLGALPLQWWRPLAWSLPIETGALVHLAPVVAGGSLLARISGPAGGHDAGFLAIATSFGVLGLLVGVTISWMYVASPGRSLSGLALAQAGIVVLAGAWAGTAGALSATRVLLLAISALFLAARWAPRKLPWPAIVPLMALAGLPLTAGYASLVAVYDAWLTNGGAVLLVIGSLLLVFALAAGILAVRRKVPAAGLGDQPPVLMARHYLALALPSLGLIALPDGEIADVSLWTWIAVVVAVAGGLVLSGYEARLQDAQLAIRRALHLGFVGRRLQRLFANIGSALDLLVRELAAILEGEGGMLWLLVFVVVIWLARK
ncbi:MAG TPA: hypothetical protein VLE70_10760 [Anaerolineae bacterium]|nr:hypothetical protein [Anaerolineae bacterium]